MRFKGLTTTDGAMTPDEQSERLRSKHRFLDVAEIVTSYLNSIGITDTGPYQMYFSPQISLYSTGNGRALLTICHAADELENVFDGKTAIPGEGELKLNVFLRKHGLMCFRTSEYFSYILEKF